MRSIFAFHDIGSIIRLLGKVKLRQVEDHVTGLLQGGSTMFRDFGRRIQRDMSRQLTERLPNAASRPKVQVMSHQMQRYAVWFGGSILGTIPEFHSICHSKAEYEEYGASICRTNAVFTEGWQMHRAMNADHWVDLWAGWLLLGATCKNVAMLGIWTFSCCI